MNNVQSMRKLIPKRKKKLKDKEAMYGKLFILPWFIGLIYFFIIPFINSIYYTFTKINIGDKGLEFSFVGFENYIFAFVKDPDYIKNLTTSIESMLYQVPIVVFFSIFVAYILRDNFKGRTYARTVFFFPVIIASGVVITILKENVLGNSSTGASTTLFNVGNLGVIFVNSGIPNWLSDLMIETINQIFDLTWRSGVQILLLMAALHNIPKDFYEAAIIEGATEWEKFWKITFPMVSPTLLVAVIYSIIDYFTDYGNSVMRMFVDQLNKGRFEYSTTIAIVYFAIIMIIVFIVNKIIGKRVVYLT